MRVISTILLAAIVCSVSARRRQCPHPDPRLHCAHGFVRDRSGCVAGCRSDPRPHTTIGPPVCIPTPGPPGTVPTGTPPPQGENNPPCPVGECGLFPPGVTPYSCPNGFALDNCGCQDSGCQCRGCPFFNNNLQCPNGYRVDHNGCPMSECNLGPDCPLPGCPAPRCGLPQPGRTLYTCPRGFFNDDCGCQDPTCQCVGCPRFDNTKFCQFGYRTRRGCPVAVCNPHPQVNSNRPSPDGSRCRDNRDCGGRGLACCQGFCMPADSPACDRFDTRPPPSGALRCPGPGDGPPSPPGAQCSDNSQCGPGTLCCRGAFGAPAGPPGSPGFCVRGVPAQGPPSLPGSPRFKPGHPGF